MASLEIAGVQPCLQTHLVPLRGQSIIYAKTLPNPWKSSQFSKKVNLYAGHVHIRRGKLFIKAVATFEPKCPVQDEDEHSNSELPAGSNTSKSQNENISEDPENLDDRERLRRMRISKSNKGNTPWNKGRKHSPETLQKIRERTKLAMQNPKVKMKLVNFGHAQSEETRLKIGLGVRMGWERRRVKQMVQETCHFEWQNLIAEAARRGYTGEEELQWDSYKILNEQFSKEWLENVEQRKSMPRVKGSKRAPKPPEQRRKIAEAISAKWADPEYRERVCSGLAKYHGTPAGAKRKPRRKPNSHVESTKRVSAKKRTSYTESSSDSEYRSQIQQLRLKKCKKPVYKDPLASSKLEMLKNIRAQRAAAESKKNEAVERARLLIAEAKTAAKALEVAATKSPVAQASLLESRKLIAEANQLIESIESRNINSDENGTDPFAPSTQLLSEIEKEIELEGGGANNGLSRQVNGTQILPFSGNEDSEFANLTSWRTVNGNKRILPSSSASCSLPRFNSDDTAKQYVSESQFDDVEQNENVKPGKDPTANRTKLHLSWPTTEFRNNPLINGNKVEVLEAKEPPLKPATVTKKWVRGKFVDITEEA